VLRRQLVVAEFVKVELNANFLRVEDVVQREQIVNGHKRRRVHIAMPSKEGTEVYISLILVELVVQLHHIEILFSMEELVLEIAPSRRILLITGCLAEPEMLDVSV